MSPRNLFDCTMLGAAPQLHMPNFSAGTQLLPIVLEAGPFLQVRPLGQALFSRPCYTYWERHPGLALHSRTLQTPCTTATRSWSGTHIGRIQRVGPCLRGRGSCAATTQKSWIYVHRVGRPNSHWQSAADGSRHRMTNTSAPVELQAPVQAVTSAPAPKLHQPA